MSDAPPSKIAEFAPTGAKLSGPGQILDYNRRPKLREFAHQLIADERFWQSAVAALRAVFDDALQHAPFVISDHPLLTLACCAAIAETVGASLHVPMRRDELWPTPDTLAAQLDHVTQQMRLDEWLQRVQEPAATPSGELLLARTWGLTPALLAETWPQQDDGDAPRLVAILREEPPRQARLTSRIIHLTVGRKRQLVAHIITELGLPPDKPCVSLDAAHDLIQRLLGATESRLLDDLLLALNTPDHHRFLSYVYQLERIERPETTALFRRNVLDEAEDHGRHAAAMFLAAHFTRLSAAQFVTIGDSLVDGSPAATPGQNERRPPRQITDMVLKQSGVRFVTAKDGNAYAVLDTGEHGSQEEPLRVAEVIRNAFDQEAPLLKERFIQLLAREMTLGHPSDNLAQEYRDLELAAMRRGDPQEASERLVEIVFSHPALSGARVLDESEILGMRQKFRRIIARVPDLIERVAKGVPALKTDEALRALSSAKPKTAEQDESRLDLFRTVGTQIFLAAYASGQLDFTLKAFPSFTNTEDTPRMRTFLDLLVPLLALTVTDPLLQDTARRLRRPETIWRLFGDAAAIVADMPDKPKSAATLLIVVASRALWLGLPLQRWRDLPLPPPGTEVAIVQAIFDRELQRFWGREFELELSEQDALPVLYLVARIVLEALLGCHAYQPNEDVAIDIWFADLLALPPSDGRSMTDLVTSGLFHSRELWARAVANEEGYEPVRVLIARLLALFPLVVTMAGSRTETSADAAAPTFAMSEALQQWLLLDSGQFGRPALEQLRDMIEEAGKIRAEWRKAHDQWSVAIRDRALLKPAFAERSEALKAFSNLIRPLLAEKRSRAPSARTASTPPPPSSPGTE